MKKNNGYTLLELMITMGFLLVITSLMVFSQEKQTRLNLAESAGSELAQINQAVENFISFYYPSLVGIDPAGEKINISSALLPAAPKKQIVCSSISGNDVLGHGRMCDIPGSLLADLGFMPTNWSGDKTSIATSGKWKIRTKVTQTSSKNGGIYYSVSAIVISEFPFSLADGIIDPGLAGRALISSKLITAGLVDYSNRANSTGTMKFYSLGDSFSFDANDWKWTGDDIVANPSYNGMNLINNPYQYGFISGLVSNLANSVYLRRDGSTSMTGDLNLNRISDPAVRTNLANSFTYKDINGVTQTLTCTKPYNEDNTGGKLPNVYPTRINWLNENSKSLNPSEIYSDALREINRLAAATDAESVRLRNIALNKKDIIEKNFICPSAHGYSVKYGADFMRFAGNLDFKENFYVDGKMQIAYNPDANTDANATIKAQKISNYTNWKNYRNTELNAWNSDLTTKLFNSITVADTSDDKLELQVNGNTTLQCDTATNKQVACSSLDARYKASLFVGVNNDRTNRTTNETDQTKPVDFTNNNWTGSGQSANYNFHNTSASVRDEDNTNVKRNTTNLEKDVVIGVTGSNKTKQDLIVKHSAITEGANVYVSGGQIVNSEMGVINDTDANIESVFAGKTADPVYGKGGLSIRDAYIWKIDAIANPTAPNASTSPVLTSLLGPYPTAYTGVVTRKDKIPANLDVSKNLIKCPTGGTPKIYLQPNVFYSEAELGVLVSKIGYAIYAENLPNAWRIHALGPDGVEIPDFGAVYTINCDFGK